MSAATAFGPSGIVLIAFCVFGRWNLPSNGNRTNRFRLSTEPAGKPPEASKSFERGEAAENGGFYSAPYDGLHGWHWENLNDTDVTITLDAAGFSSEARFYPLNSPAQRIEIPSRRNTQTSTK